MAFSSRSPGVSINRILAAGPGINGGSFAEARVFAKPGYGGAHRAVPMLPAIEWIASRLALSIGLPTPTGQIGELSDGRKTWVSLLVQLSGQLPAPPDPAVVVAAEPRLSAGTFVFDVWILNNDRHDENLLFHPDLGLWLIDHDLSLSGPIVDDPGRVLPPLNDRPITNHVFHGALLNNKDIGEWVRLIEALPMSVINSIIDTGRRAGIYTEPYGAGIRKFLRYRKTALAELVHESRR